MEMQTIILIGTVALYSLTQVIALCKGDKTTAEKVELKKQKLINKLQKKHAKTEKQFIKEEKKIQELKEE